MTDRGSSLEQAQERASAARIEFQAAVQDIRQWFTPDRLKAEAAIAATRQIDSAKAAVRRSVKRHPLAAWSGLTIIAAITTYGLRRPVAALTRAGIGTVRSVRQSIVRRKKKP